MSRSFSSTSDYLRATIPVLSGYPISMSIWGYFAGTAGYQCMWLGDQGTNNGTLSIGTQSAASGQKVTALRQITDFNSGPPNFVSALSTASHSTGTWQQLGLAAASATSLAAVLDGVVGTVVTTASTALNFSVMDTITIARFDRTSAFGLMDGQLAHAALWSADLTAAEWAMLGAGISPLRVRPQSLKFYWPFMGRDTNDIDIIGKLSFTATGTTVSPNEPRIIWSLPIRGIAIEGYDGPVPVPADPTGLTATSVSSSEILLEWTDNAGDESGFRIEQSLDGISFTEVTTLGADSEEYTVGGLAAATTYYFRVRAYNSGGNSGYSNTDSATTQAAVVVSLFRNTNNEVCYCIQGNVFSGGVQDVPVAREYVAKSDWTILQVALPGNRANDLVTLAAIKAIRSDVKLFMYVNPAFYYDIDVTDQYQPGYALSTAINETGTRTIWRARLADGTLLSHQWNPVTTNATNRSINSINLANSVTGVRWTVRWLGLWKSNLQGLSGFWSGTADPTKNIYQYYDGLFFDDSNISGVNLRVKSTGAGVGAWDYDNDGDNDSDDPGLDMGTAYRTGFVQLHDDVKSVFPGWNVGRNSDVGYWYTTSGTNCPPRPFSSTNWYHSVDYGFVEGTGQYLLGLGDFNFTNYLLQTFFSLPNLFLKLELEYQTVKPVATNPLGKPVVSSQQQMVVTWSTSVPQIHYDYARFHWGITKLIEGYAYGCVFKNAQVPFFLDESCIDLGAVVGGTRSMGSLDQSVAPASFTMRAPNYQSGGAKFYWQEFANAIVIVRLDTTGLTLGTSMFGDGTAATCVLPNPGAGYRWDRFNASSYVHPTYSDLAMVNQSPLVNSGATDLTTVDLKPLHCVVLRRTAVVDSFPRLGMYWIGQNRVQLPATYSQSGTTITVTMADHGLTAGGSVVLTVISGGATSGTYTVAGVTNDNVFTVTSSTSTTTSGNLTVRGSFLNQYQSATGIEMMRKRHLVVINGYPELAAFRRYQNSAIVSAVKAASTIGTKVYMYYDTEAVPKTGGAFVTRQNKIAAQNWYLYSTGTSGTPLNSYYSTANYAINVTDFVPPDSSGRNAMEWMADYEPSWIWGGAESNTAGAAFDGIFMDNVLIRPRNNGDFNRDGVTDTATNATVASWYRSGLASGVTQFNASALGIGKTVLGNCADWFNSSDWGLGALSASVYWKAFDGGVFEHAIGASFSVETWGNTAKLVSSIQLTEDALIDPTLGMFHAYPTTGGLTSYQEMRHAMACCLVTSNMAFAFAESYAQNTTNYGWFDEYDFNLGTPSETRKTAATQNGIWRRDFQNGIVLWCPKGVTGTINLGGTFYRLTGSQAPSVNSGAAVTSVTFSAARDGLVLSKTPTGGALAVSALPAFNTQTPTKYVSLTGSVNGNFAYTTMQAAVDAAVPGDVIAVAPGVYPHGFTITNSGTPTNRIYIQALDPNNKPVIDGQNVRPGNWSYGVKGVGSAFIRVAASYVTVDSIDMRNSNRNFFLLGPWNNNGGFLFPEDINRYYYGVEVLRCVCTNSTGWGAVTINTFDSLIGGCEIRYTCRNMLGDIAQYGNPLNWGAALLVFGRRVSIIENVIGQTLGEGIHFGQHIDWDPREWAELYDPVSDLYVTPQEIQATDCIIRGNEIFDCYSGLIYVTSVEGGVIENNLIYNSEDTEYWYWSFDPVTKARIAPSTPGNLINVGNEGALNRGVSAAPPTKFIGAKNLIIRNNVLFNGVRGLYFASWPRNTTNNIVVQNNTIFRGSILSGQYEESLAYNGQSNLTYVTFENNLVYDPRGKAANSWVATPNSVFRNNIFSNTPPTTMNGAGNIISANVGIANANYSVAARPFPDRPVFNRDVFRLLPGSPAIGAGYLNGNATDFFGSSRSSTSMDIGAVKAP